MIYDDDISGIFDRALDIGEEFLGSNTSSAVAGATLGAVTTGGIIAGISAIKRRSAKTKRKTSRTKKKTTSRGRSRDRKFISKQKHEQAYIKRKKKAGKPITRKRYKTSSTRKKKVGKIYKTKNGQPYKILSSGKAKFIKKR